MKDDWPIATIRPRSQYTGWKALRDIGVGLFVVFLLFLLMIGFENRDLANIGLAGGSRWGPF